jgi:tRNA-specific 2-thiouridylase
VRVVVAMSGGVDSSVAAAMLKEEGHEVIGVTMQLWSRPDEKKGSNGSGDSGSHDAIEDAGKVAYKLGIPHHVMDFRDIFNRTIIADFCREYSEGRTPNPCVRCNQYIKFGILWERARELGADFLATGHHARIETGNSGKYLLKKGKDRQKDQSYFLCQLKQEQLSRVLFPIGNLTKDIVRQIARELGLPITDRPESQEICFIPDDNHAAFLKNQAPLPAESGPIIERQGKVLGQHQGIMFYTIGQRKGLGLTAARPLYVTAIESKRNAIVVGSKEQTYADELVTDNLNWIAGVRPEQPINVKARVRYRHPEAEAIVSPMDETSVYVKFAEPQMAITPGQAVVFYDGDTVIGGGTIIRQGR